MPSCELVNAFVRDVLANDHVRAIERWYAPDASMQENQQAPRKGRDFLVRHEKAVLAEMICVTSQILGNPMIDGENVAIVWRFTFERLDGCRMSMDEVAIQRWKDGRIVHEQFFYDPGQLRPSHAGATNQVPVH